MSDESGAIFSVGYSLTTPEGAIRDATAALRSLRMGEVREHDLPAFAGINDLFQVLANESGWKALLDVFIVLSLGLGDGVLDAAGEDVYKGVRRALKQLRESLSGPSASQEATAAVMEIVKALRNARQFTNDVTVGIIIENDPKRAASVVITASSEEDIAFQVTAVAAQAAEILNAVVKASQAAGASVEFNGGRQANVVIGPDGTYSVRNVNP